MVTESVAAVPNSTYTERNEFNLNYRVNDLESFKPTVISGICSTNARRVFAALTSNSKSVRTGSRGSDNKPVECLEIQPQLADVIGGFFDGVCTRSRSSRSI